MGIPSKPQGKDDRRTCEEILLVDDVEVVSNMLWRGAVGFSKMARERLSLLGS